MTVEEAVDFFSAVPSIRDKLTTLHDVGLGYIHLGQAATTLSGGEAQRVKLAKELSRRATGRTIYILDEPTTGLHFEDVRKLLDVLHALVESGNTVVVIEHNLEVVKTAGLDSRSRPRGWRWRRYDRRGGDARRRRQGQRQLHGPVSQAIPCPRQPYPASPCQAERKQRPQTRRPRRERSLAPPQTSIDGAPSGRRFAIFRRRSATHGKNGSFAVVWCHSRTTGSRIHVAMADGVGCDGDAIGQIGGGRELSGGLVAVAGEPAATYRGVLCLCTGDRRYHRQPRPAAGRQDRAPGWFRQSRARHQGYRSGVPQGA